MSKKYNINEVKEVKNKTKAMQLIIVIVDS